MKQTLLFTLSSLALATLMTACGSQVADKIAVVGQPSYFSDPCAVIDEKVVRLDRFTEVVQNTSAFHLEEKATAIPVPGITVSNNKKQMLRDVEKKQAEYAAERQKYGCESSMSTGNAPMTDKKKEVNPPAYASDSCYAIDKKLIQLAEFTTMVNNTSAFHLEEKAAALPVPGITVSNNKKQMLRDAKKKQAALLQARQKQGCETPDPTHTEPITEKKSVVNSTNTVPMAAKTAAQPLPAVSMEHKKAPIAREVTKKQAAPEIEHQKYVDETSLPGTAPMDDKKAELSTSAGSSDACAAINKKLVELYEFTIMVKNTSAFHLEEKAAALSVPGITVSNNKKKMLKDAEKKSVELLAEREKQGCITSTK